MIRYPVTGAYDYDTCVKLVQAELPADGRYVVLGESFSGPVAPRRATGASRDSLRCAPVAITLAAQAPRGLAGVILSSSFAANPRPRLSIIRPLLPYLPFHGTGTSVRPRIATRVIQQHAPAAHVVEIEGPHCLLQCTPTAALARIREFLQAL